MTDQHLVLTSYPLTKAQTYLRLTLLVTETRTRASLTSFTLSVGQDQQDWLGGWKLTDQLERRTQRILNDQEGQDLSWLTEGPTSLPELMDSVHGGC